MSSEWRSVATMLVLNREVHLPVTAKLPQEDHERLLAAAELGDSEAVTEAAKELENRGGPLALAPRFLPPPSLIDKCDNLPIDPEGAQLPSGILFP